MLELLTVLARSNEKTDLALLEAILIKQRKTVIYKQVKDFSRTLKIFLLVYVSCIPEQDRKMFTS